MADKVDSQLEKMVDELQFYKDEALFSAKELTHLVKARKAAEYSLVRKDADVSFFLDAIKFERKLEATKRKRMARQRKAQKEAGI
jgi:predicted N-acyltransferase